MQVEKVDRLIDVLADDITEKVQRGTREYREEIEEKVKALAELIVAKASAN